MQRYLIGAINRLCLLLLLCGGAVSAQAQNFTIDTLTTNGALGNVYDFTLNYVQSGMGQPLQGDIYEWSFYLDAGAPEPFDVMSPAGWKHIYDSVSGEFDWYTEGPNGITAGDFGPYVLTAGNSLDGFSLTTTLEPSLSVAFASDTQQNMDINFAVIPALAPAAVPEPGVTITSAGFAVALLCRRRSARRGRSSSATSIW